jgi:hypothetical protein
MDPGLRRGCIRDYKRRNILYLAQRDNLRFFTWRKGIIFRKIVFKKFGAYSLSLARGIVMGWLVSAFSSAWISFSPS